MREREWVHEAGTGAEPVVRGSVGSASADVADAADVVDGAVAVPRSSRVRFGIGAAVVLLLGAFVVAVIVSAANQQGSTSSVTPVGASPSPGALSSPTPSPSRAPELLVHVLGAVADPGLVTLAAGSRVVDALAAAGGLADDANVAGVNLARPVSDGEQLTVPAIGEPLPVPAPGGSGAASGPTSGGGTVNLNSATQADLETLPRIGPTLASRILDYRTANGGFTAPTDLLQVTGIGQKLFDGLNELVTV